MADIVDPATRSRMMSGIRSGNTRPERIVRSLLHRMGFRFRIHVRSLPGTPDIVLPRWRAVIFVHGCFWHGHGCANFRLPATRREFWSGKIAGNRDHDRAVMNALWREGWRVALVWECALRGATANPVAVAERLAQWLRGTGSFIEIPEGRQLPDPCCLPGVR